MKKILLALMGASLLVLPVFAGGNQNRNSAAGEKMPLSIGFWWEAEGKMFSPNDELGKYIEDKFNVTITPVNYDWSDYSEQFRLWAASDSLPDVWSSAPALESWFGDFIRQDVIRSIPDAMIAKYPTIKKWGDTNPLFQEVKNFYGAAYYVPKPDSVKGLKVGAETGFYYRRDWAEKLGIRDTPKNMDDVYNLLRAFVYNDPDGNGRRDTYGVTTGGTGALFAPFGAFPGQWINGSGGKVMPGWLEEEPMIEALTWLRRAWNEGLIDTEFPPDWNTVASKFAQGTFGMMHRSTTAMFIERHIMNEFGGANPQIKDPLNAVGFAVSLAAKSGAAPYHELAGEIWGNTFRADLSDAKLEKLLEIKEWLAGREGMDLCNWGFKDKDYRVNADGSYTSLLQGSILDKYPSRTIIFYSTWNYDFDAEENPAIRPEAKKISLDVQMAINVGGANAARKVNQFASAIDTEEKSLWTYDYSSRVMEIITGTGDIRTMYRAMIAEANRQGLQEMINSVNAVLKK